MASDHRDEKQDEKQEEKQEEKVEEKYHRDPLGSIVGACVLIWAGVVLLAVNLDFLQVFAGLLSRLSIRPYELPVGVEIPFFQPGAWQVFFFGAGVILVVEIILRLIVPSFRRRMLGTLIGVIVFFALALGNWVLIGPLIVIAVGVSILLSALLRRR